MSPTCSPHQPAVSLGRGRLCHAQVRQVRLRIRAPGLQNVGSSANSSCLFKDALLRGVASAQAFPLIRQRSLTPVVFLSFMSASCLFWYACECVCVCSVVILCKDAFFLTLQIEQCCFTPSSQSCICLTAFILDFLLLTSSCVLHGISDNF